jgi:hypothetical protein
MERIEFEDVIVEQPPKVRVDSTKKTGKEIVMPEGPTAEDEVKELNPDKVDSPGGTDGRSSSSSEEGEADTSEDEEEQVDIVDSEDMNVSDDENQPVGVFENVYKPICKEVPDRIDSERQKAVETRASVVQKKVDSKGATLQIVQVSTKQVCVIRRN